MIFRVIAQDGLVRLSINGTERGLHKPISELGINRVPFERMFKEPTEFNIGSRVFKINPGDTVSLQ